MINLPIFYRLLQFSIQDNLKIIICIKNYMYINYMYMYINYILYIKNKTL